MSTQFKTKSFKKLQTDWYKKIKDQGFDDIEKEDENLKVWHSYFCRTYKNKTFYEAKEEYYRLAGQFLYAHSFRSNLELDAWKLHSEGVSIRNIVLELKAKGYKAHKNSILMVLQQLRKDMLAFYRKSTP